MPNADFPPTQTAGSNAAWEARRLAATPRGVGVLESFYAARAQNAEIWDIEGNRYIDFAGGIGVLNLGHANPRVVAAVQAQAAKFTHTCYQVVPYSGYVELAEKMAARAPGNFAKKTMFVTTGAEAVENAVKIARAATGRSGIIAFDAAFHGRTLMGMALTGKVAPYKMNFGPMPADVYHAPFPNPLHGVSVEDAMAGIQRLFKCDIDPKRVAAFIFEPVQGEGGFYQAPAEFIHALRKLADEHGILLISDEVQAGAARTGKFFASEHYHGVEFDLFTFAKSVGAGLPIAGVTGRAELMDAPAPGGLGGTYAGNPLAVAAALEVLKIIDEENLPARATKLGDTLKARLNALRAKVPAIADVRGPGSMVAVEFIKDGKPAPEMAKAVQTYAQKHGLILLTCGAYYNIIRFLYPLTIQDEVFAEGLDILEQAILHA
ncbi:4-aminobutyrate--2-oxoglutarate transaminase [Acidocella sp. KAb 2-4]|uniref:4-aminobutyrate--2-oxoglutarate transaminase n=1 Tax=Acidocella sp. KAb 2-4 TaxID=2885158 RepID=UPI001D0942D9|nr:4-aminobutyrate--2-oxoglutarate transaminase [Acidocella sp. KAb 2-4]MCB5943611.1 4-aminobutyrate--2-oxoglutarate transaminase [Acidocella sp. KAb 2-4]